MPLLNLRVLAASFPWENLVFLAFIVIAMIFRLVGKVFESTRKNSQPPPVAEPTPRAEPEGDETERIRRFLEALGQPANAPPPRRAAPVPPAPRPASKPRARTVRPIDPFPRPNFPLPPLLEAAPPPLPTTAAPPAVAPQVPVTATEVRPSAPADRRVSPVTPLAPALDVISLMRSSGEGLRQAVILREILGPPRGLE